MKIRKFLKMKIHYHCVLLRIDRDQEYLEVQVFNFYKKF